MNASRTAEGLNALKMELNLNQSADDHSKWMSDNLTFSHTGMNNSSATDRMNTADVNLTGSWGTGENIAAFSGYTSETDNPVGQAQAIHTALMNSPGHRANIMNPDFTHVGLGIYYGPMAFGDSVVNASITTQNFAYSGGPLDEDILSIETPIVVPITPVDIPIDIPIDTPLDWIGTAQADTYTGTIGNDTLDGKGGNDTLDGGAGNDFLKGGKGDDTLQDTQGDNKLNGQKGRDLIMAGDGDDRLNGGGGADTLDAGAGNDFLKGGTRNDLLNGGGGNDLLFGNRHNDTLNGGAGDDTLNGGGDDDRLSGGMGDDLIKGGAGADVFVFNAGHDVITDYNADVDRIELDAALAGNDAANLIATLTTATAEGALIDFGNGNTLEIHGIFTLEQLEADLSFF